MIILLLFNQHVEIHKGQDELWVNIVFTGWCHESRSSSFIQAERNDRNATWTVVPW